MGIDISGFIEVRPWATWPDLPSEIEWEAAARLDCLYVNRDYDAFGCLFGVMNMAGFRPLAQERGLPADVSAQVRDEHTALGEHDGLWPTWIGWSEILAIDWDEPAEHADARLHRYERQDDGPWRFTSKSAWSREAFEAQGIPAPPPGSDAPIWSEGSQWTRGDVQYRAERLTRREAIPIGSQWDPLWEAMALYAKLHGDEQCRLVVWFDR